MKKYSHTIRELELACMDEDSRKITDNRLKTKTTEVEKENNKIKGS